jgi:hypothetical protein
MEQQALFHEDINDALRAAVKACGGTKSVACRLWPEKTINDAQSYLNDCLNSARPAKLSPEQVLLLLRWTKEAGYHGAMHYLCNEAGYEAPKPLDPIVQRDRLAEELSRAADNFARLTKEVQRMSEPTLRVA